MTVEADIALGAKVFYRTDKLANLLKSACEAPISRVYIADDGVIEEREHLYNRDYPFELTVLDLDYDAGLGQGRARIVEELDEEFLLMVDSDHEVLSVEPMYEVLNDDESLGGVAGLMYRRDGTVEATCHDLYEYDDGNHRVLVRDIDGEKDFDVAAGYPYVQFDYVPNAALYRAECLNEYAWDSHYVIGKDHLDFYIGHRERTDWDFAIALEATLLHNPGGDSGYLWDRLDTRKTWESKRYFLQKWGYDQIVFRRHWTGNVVNESTADRLVQRLSRRIPLPGADLSTERKLMDLHDYGMRAKATLYDYYRE
jgi:hypothetical protein